jgi:site-specific DNA recombinase
MDTAIDIDAEGNSIATQREACLAKAHKLRASVVKEFIEPGNSAKDIEHRPVFKSLLAFLADHRDIDYLIVYMYSRAFRNLTDAALTNGCDHLTWPHFGLRSA